MQEAGDTGPHPGAAHGRRPILPVHPDPAPSDPGQLRRVAARLLTGWVTRVFGDHATPAGERVSEADLRLLIAANTGTGHVRELMVPRTEVVFLDAGLTVSQAVATVRAARHSRFPVIDGDQDDVIGFVHLRDLALPPPGAQSATVRELTREVKRLPASKRVLAALSEMRREGQHLAVVVDEYGGTAGIVTLEDLIEELVGEIHDEYDPVPEPAHRAGPGPSEADGRLNLADFAERTGLALPAGPYETVAGFLMCRLGKLPQTGDEVPFDGWLLTVLALDGRRVARVGVVRPVPPPRAPTIT